MPSRLTSFFNKETAEKLAKKLTSIAGNNIDEFAKKAKKSSVIAFDRSKKLALKNASKARELSGKVVESSKTYIEKNWPQYSVHANNTLAFCSKRKKGILAGTGIIIAGGFVFTSCTKESCPNGFLSMGGGYCREVVCESINMGTIDLITKKAFLGQKPNFQDSELEARAKEAGLTCKGKGGIMGSYLKWGKNIVPSK